MFVNKSRHDQIQVINDPGLSIQLIQQSNVESIGKYLVLLMLLRNFEISITDE